MQRSGEPCSASDLTPSPNEQKGDTSVVAKHRNPFLWRTPRKISRVAHYLDLKVNLSPSPPDYPHILDFSVIQTNPWPCRWFASNKRKKIFVLLRTSELRRFPSFYFVRNLQGTSKQIEAVSVSAFKSLLILLPALPSAVNAYIQFSCKTVISLRFRAVSPKQFGEGKKINHGGKKNNQAKYVIITKICKRLDNLYRKYCHGAILAKGWPGLKIKCICNIKQDSNWRLSGFQFGLFLAKGAKRNLEGRKQGQEFSLMEPPHSGAAYHCVVSAGIPGGIPQISWTAP